MSKHPYNITNTHLIEIILDEETILRRSPEVELERKVAVRDILAKNSFRLLFHKHKGPYSLRLQIEGNHLIFHINDTEHNPLKIIILSLSPFRSLLKDYFLVCDSHAQAIRTSPKSRIQTIDMGRRSLHNEGSQLLTSRLQSKVELDFETARRIFTLICALLWRGQYRC